MTTRWKCGFLTGALLWGAATVAHAQVPPGDVAVTLNPNSLVSLSMDGASSALNLTASTASIALVSQPGCVASASQVGCLAQIAQFKISLASFSMDTTVGHFDVTNPTVMLASPTMARDTGSGYVVPAGTKMAFLATVGASLSNEHVVPTQPATQITPLTAPAVFTLSTATQDLTIDGSFPFQISNPLGDTVTGTVTIMATAAKPFMNTPPTANAGPDQTVSCGQQVTLNGSASTDLENNIVRYLWAAHGSLIATGAVAQVNLPPGVNIVQLNVQDAFTATGLDQMKVTVQEAPPVFTLVPPAFQATGCGALNIGQAQASSACGAVTITNNAPASFPVGQTLVTWTATSPSGMTAHATQQVTVFLGNDPKCCPAGTHVIVGTSNNDTLTGTAGADCILGLGGQDTINGLGGNDIISGGDGDDIIHGGDGDDLISGGTGQDQIFGEAGNDTLYGDDGDDHVDGGDGNDVLFGGQGQDTLICGAGTNQAFGGIGDDTLQGGPGNDILDGGPDHNTCIGGGGSDQFISCTTVR
jgi:Ca2+-binding RTX toxin-like protein